jgi:hypothetical protein
MVLSFDTEPIQEYYSFELAQAAHKLVSEVRPLHKG